MRSSAIVAFDARRYYDEIEERRNPSSRHLCRVMGRPASWVWNQSRFNRVEVEICAIMRRLSAIRSAWYASATFGAGYRWFHLLLPSAHSFYDAIAVFSLFIGKMMALTACAYHFCDERSILRCQREATVASINISAPIEWAFYFLSEFRSGGSSVS